MSDNVINNSNDNIPETREFWYVWDEPDFNDDED